MFASGITVNETPAVIMYAVSALFLALSFVILLGKGDFLISGYNTASEEEKAKYDMPRLRMLIFLELLVVSAGLVLITALELGEVGIGVFASVVVLLSIVMTVLANTWAKKR